VATDVIMPALGIAQETGKLLQWLRAEGDEVKKGEPVMEIETDKVTVEIEAPASGILAAFSAQPGDDVPVGQTIALILAPGEEAAAPGPPSLDLEAIAAAAAPTRVMASPTAAPAAAPPLEAPLPAAPATGDGQRSKPLASPKARRLAQELGIDIATVTGSGPGGAVVAADVAALAPAAPAAPVAPAPAAEPLTAVGSTWRLMAERTTESWTTAPHFYLVREVSAERLISWREAIGRRGLAVSVTYTDLLVKLAAVALREHPRVNASWRDGSLELHREVNIGIAAAVDDGLVAPVVHGVDGLTLAQIAERRADVVERARAGRLRLEDVQGGTFTITNLGMFGIDAFNAIVVKPQAAILAVGRIAERVVAVGGQPAVCPMLVLTLSCDHRAVDGARAAAFLDFLAGLVEEPAALVE
jgi:pyruvate dehydrogenase E2 component (dihydrolipoamide acetyltransferase)